MTRKSQLNPFLGKAVEITFLDGSKECGTLGYTSRFSAEFNYRQPGYYTIGDKDFKVKEVYCVKEVTAFVDEQKATLLKLLAQEPTEVLSLAFVYAKNFQIYGGVNVSEKWMTAVEQSSNLERAYHKGFEDGYSKAATHAKASDISD